MATDPIYGILSHGRFVNSYCTQFKTVKIFHIRNLDSCQLLFKKNLNGYKKLNNNKSDEQMIYLINKELLNKNEM